MISRVFVGSAMLAAASMACGSAESSAPAPDAYVGGAGGASTGALASSSRASASTGSMATSAPAPLGPPYPIVLAHGFLGFDQFAGIDGATYFYRVKDRLTELGEDVYTPEVDPFNSSVHRGAQLLRWVETIVLRTGRAKVNLIAHSQGGLDARYVAHERPDLVASVITIGTPHYGTPLADVALEVGGNQTTADIVDALVKLLGAPLFDAIGNTTSAAAAIVQFSQPAMTAFNATYTDRLGVYYASIAGRSGLDSGGSGCTPDEHVPFVDQWASDIDPVDPLLAVTEGYLAGTIVDHHENDGLVRATDARWGTFWGCLPADHLDEVGQLFGDSPGWPNDFDYMDLYVELVARLRASGY